MLYSNPITYLFPNTVHQWFSSPCSLWGAAFLIRLWGSKTHHCSNAGVSGAWQHSVQNTLPFPFIFLLQESLARTPDSVLKIGSTLHAQKSRVDKVPPHSESLDDRPATTSRTDKWGISWLGRSDLTTAPLRLATAPCRTRDCPMQTLLLPLANSRTASLELWFLPEINDHSRFLCFASRTCPKFSREREKYSKDTPQLMLTMTHHCQVLSLPLHMVVFREDREPHSGLYPLTMHQRFPSLHGLGTSSESAKMIITPECNRGISWRITSIHRLETYSVSPKRIITPDTNGGRTWRVPSLCHLRTPSVSPNRL